MKPPTIHEWRAACLQGNLVRFAQTLCPPDLEPIAIELFRQAKALGDGLEKERKEKEES